MIYGLSLLALLIVASLIAILAYSVKIPSDRIWPPPGRWTWQYNVTWLLFLSAFGLLLILGVLDWNSLDWPATIRWTVGGTLIVVGNLMAWVGVWQLGVKQSGGEKGRLMTRGVYQFTRNPQYVGDILILVGWMILSASMWCLPLAIGGIVAFVLTPFAEEPWLEELHGDDYREYKSQVPRFIFF